MASNTAHVNIDLFKYLSLSPVEDLTNAVVDHACAQQASCSLILGTIVGHKYKLYESKFMRKGLKFLVPEDSEKDLVQDIINKIKQKQLYDNGESLFVLIQKVCQQISTRDQRIDTILLGCTELPIALIPYSSRFRTVGIDIIDSEAVFANKIASIIEM